MTEVRKVGLFAVMIGALSLSFSGQVAAVSPLLGTHMAVVFALTNDLASLLALNEVMGSDSKSVRRWSWVSLWMAGGTALGLNTWHALSAVGQDGKPVLPGLAAVAVGAGPVVLAWVLSHVVALVMAGQRAEARAEAAHQVPAVDLAEPVRPAPVDQVAEPAHQVAHQAAPADLVAHQVAHQVAPGGLVEPGDLVERARRLLTESAAAGRSMGRGRLARELEISENQARQLLHQVTHQAAPGDQASRPRALQAV